MASATDVLIEPASGREPQPVRSRADISKRAFVAVTLLLVSVGLLLRLWNIGFGLPAVYHPDEYKKVAIIDRILKGLDPDFSIHPLTHPGLMVSMAAEACRVAIGLGMPQTPQNKILVGRILASLFSAATILAAGLLAAMLFNRRAGVLAAAIVAFSPVHIVHARYLKEDAFIDTFIMASLAGAVWWIASDSGAKRKWGLIVCAAGAGFAAGTKYVGLVVPIFLMVYFYMNKRATRGERAWFAAIACVTLSLGAIMLLTHSEQIGYELKYAFMRGAHTSETEAPLQIYNRRDLGTYFLFHGINWGLGWPLTIMGIWGLVRGIRTRRTHSALWLVAAMTLLWYLSAEMTTLKRAPDSERYILSCIPMLAVLAAGFIMSLRWKYWPAIGCVLVAMLAGESAAMTYSLKPDTREVAARWIRAQTNGKPCPLAYLDAPQCYQPNHEILKEYKYITLTFAGIKAGFSLKPAKSADILMISHFASDRFEKYRKLCPGVVKDIKKLRKMYPYAKIIEKPWYARNGFHNPVIEVRFKKPFTEPAKP